MRRLFGLKSKSSGPLEPLSTNHDSRAEKQQGAEGKPRVGSTKPAPTATAQHGLGLSIPAETGQDDSHRSLHAHFASSPIVHTLPSSESTSSDPSASANNPFRRPSTSSTAPVPAAASKDTPLGYPRVAPGRGVSRDGAIEGSAEGVVPAGGSRSMSPQSLALQRTTSPLSFSPSGSFGGSTNPYSHGGGSSIHPSLARVVSERSDPHAIYAPTTWSELANPELVDNVSNRERTRQEILWEVVASEERYVLELRSLVNLYVNPLLHPLLAGPSPTLPPSPPTPYTPSPPSSAELPIAARFQRLNNASEDSLARPPTWGRTNEMPEIDGSDESLSHGSGSRRPTPTRSHNSLPVLPRGDVRPFFSAFASSTSLAQPSDEKPRGGRLSSFSFRPRQSLRPVASSSKLRKPPSKALVEDGTPLTLPEPLKNVMESLVEMLRGHEELSARLKEQWAKAFPLVRGLAAIWSEQPWFLETYAKYVLSLEEALAAVDELLPSLHNSPSLPSFKIKSRATVDKNQRRLARALVSLEEQAAESGESSLGICLSKPLMRLSKLPLLMQALLYHTDPTTHEWEKTRAMALEVDALVRSIEDEKIDEEAREKTRDALARIEGIKDKALMAPRSSRVLLDEIPVPRECAARRTVSDASSRKIKTASNEWFVRFSDVTIRCVKTRETDLPGGFSRQKEKQGKQGKVKKGKSRNLYRFVKVERWEMREAAGAAVVGMDDICRAAANIDAVALESSEEDDDMDGAESRMSFRYDADDPKPSAPRTFKKDHVVPRNGPRTSTSTTQSVVAKQSPAAAKHGGRLRIASEGGMPRVTSPVSRHRFEAPTRASAAKVTTIGVGRPNTPHQHPLTAPSATVSSPPPAKSTSNGLHVREDSSMDLLQAFWKADAPAPTS